MQRRYFINYSLLLLASCTTVINNSNRSFLQENTGNSLEKLRLTVTDVQNFQELQRAYGAFQTALKQILEREIELIPFESYTSAAAALQSDRLDLALTGPSEYVVMHARTNAVPIVAITRPNYYSIICVSAHSEIQSIAQLKGKKIALWKVGSTSGHLGATKLLMDAGLNPKSDLKILMLESQGLSALQNGEVDAWGGSSARYAEFLKEKGLSEKALRLLAQSPLLPNDLIVASSKIDIGLIKEIGERMIKNQDKLIQSLLPVENGKYNGSQLVPVKDSDYNMVREVYKAIGQGSFIP